METNSNLIKKILFLESKLSEGFVGREEEARVAILAIITRNHSVFIGEPGTAKSALIHRLSKLINAKYFYYLISRYTNPDELIGNIDPIQFRNGKFVRNVKGKLPEAEIAFIDEVFKGNTECLNTLLSIMNERMFVDVDGTVYKVPLWSLFGASNEEPRETELAAFYDRFLLKHFVNPLSVDKLTSAIKYNISRLKSSENIQPVLSMNEIKQIYQLVVDYMINHVNEIADAVANVATKLRSRGIYISDRTAIGSHHFPLLVSAYSTLYNTRPSNAAVIVSKYLVPSAELMKTYREVLNELIPSELAEAMKLIEKARETIISGDLNNARDYAVKALNIAMSAMEKPDKFQLYIEDFKRIYSEAEAIINEVEKTIEQLKTRWRKQ